MLPLRAACHGCPAWEALQVAMVMAMTWPFASAWPSSTIRPLLDVGSDQVSDKRGNAFPDAGAELAQLVLLDIVQRDLQRAFAFQVWFGAHAFLLVRRRFRMGGAG
jgi:hypothetical protein